MLGKQDNKVVMLILHSPAVETADKMLGDCYLLSFSLCILKWEGDAFGKPVQKNKSTSFSGRKVSHF